MLESPRWLDIFIKLVRPGVMVAMFWLLVTGGMIFGFVDIFWPGDGERAMRTFVGFLAAIDNQFYETLRFMFGAYVLGRSGQEIAKEITEQKKVTAGQPTDAG